MAQWLDGLRFRYPAEYISTLGIFQPLFFAGWLGEVGGGGASRRGQGV